MKIMLRRLVLTTGILALAVGVAAAPARAGTYGEAPWCAVINTGDGDVTWDCQYRTVEECAPNVIAGNRGSCTQNPRWVPPTAAAPQRYRKRHS